MNHPSTMQAVFIEDNTCHWRETTIPVPAPGEVLIRTEYAGINRADLFQRDGSYPPPEGAANIPGLEVSGVVEQIGANVCNWRPGDTVCALLSSGGYAEYTLAHQHHCLRIPDSFSMAEAACLPECATTVWMALWDEAGLEAGQRVLIHGGCSGVGVMAIQMAKVLGCEVWATAGSAEKCERIQQLGAQAIVYKTQSFEDILRDAGGVDIILDMVGGDYIERNLRSLRAGGTLVSIAFLKGSKVEVSAGRLLLKRLKWLGTSLRARSNEDKARLLLEMQEFLWPLCAEGGITPVIDSIFAPHELDQAHERMQNYLHCGKILLQMRHST